MWETILCTYSIYQLLPLNPIEFNTHGVQRFFVFICLSKPRFSRRIMRFLNVVVLAEVQFQFFQKVKILIKMIKISFFSDTPPAHGVQRFFWSFVDILREKRACFFRQPFKTKGFEIVKTYFSSKKQGRFLCVWFF